MFPIFSIPPGATEFVADMINQSSIFINQSSIFLYDLWQNFSDHLDKLGNETIGEEGLNVTFGID